MKLNLSKWTECQRFVVNLHPTDSEIPKVGIMLKTLDTTNNVEVFIDGEGGYPLADGVFLLYSIASGVVIYHEEAPDVTTTVVPGCEYALLMSQEGYYKIRTLEDGTLDNMCVTTGHNEWFGNIRFVKAAGKYNDMYVNYVIWRYMLSPDITVILVADRAKRNQTLLYIADKLPEMAPDLHRIICRVDQEIAEM